MRPVDIMSLCSAQDPHLSANGNLVAWCETSLDKEADRAFTRIMTAPADGSAPPRPFTEGPADLQPRFSPDGRHLAFLSADGGQPSLRLAPMSGGMPRTVELPGPMSYLAWSPSGDRVVLVVNLGGRSQDDSPQAHNAPVVVRGLFGRLDGAGYRSGRDHLFVLDVSTGALHQVTRGDYDHAFPEFSPDGERLVFVSDRGQGRDDRLVHQDLWAMAASGGRLARLTRGFGGAQYPTFSPDGKKVAFAGAARPADAFHRDPGIFVVDSDGRGNPERLVPELDRPTGITLGPGRPFAWIADDELVFNVADRGSLAWYRARLGARKPIEVATGELQSYGVAVGGSGRGRRIAYEAKWVDQPSEIFVAAVHGGTKAVQVSDAGKNLLGAVELLPATRHRATSPDGIEVEYFLMRPRPAQAGGGGRRSVSRSSGRARGVAPPPIFVEIHGGPSLYNPLSELLGFYQVLAGAGYAVVLPNPRGSIGYGEGFRRLAMHDWGGGDLADIEACADDAIERGNGDVRRQFVGGYSYGGFMTAWTIGHTGRFKAAIVGAPVVDQVSMFGTTDIPWFSAAHIGGDPWTEPDAFRARSPLTHLPQATTPVLLHVNEGDLRCPPGQSDQLYSALRWLGKEVEYVRYPGGSHLSFFPTMGGTPSQSVDRMTRFLDFLGRHGGLRPPA